jgi:cytosine/adenosine deaminase-related metal-dependent hydrolase
MFGVDFNKLDAGAAADLVVLDYDPPTPLTSENLAWHLAFGLNSTFVESVMVGGRFVIRNRRHALDGEVYVNARRASEKLWSKLRA